MIPVLSREQMRAFDRHAIEACHVPGLILMENAGRSAVEIFARLAPLQDASILCICGPGNNGGDGFVVARHLLCRHIRVKVLLLGATESVMGDARIHLDGFTDLDGDVSELRDEGGLAALDEALREADIVVDALFGTGLCRPLEGLLAEVVRRTNAAPVLRFALDLPSGLDADLGSPLGETIVAHHTVTFGHWKAGLLTPEGARLAGEVHVASLGVPESIVASTGHMARILEPSCISAVPARARSVHKHDAGSVLVVGGSRGRTGAALLAAKAALRAGAGLATIATWTEALSSVEGRLLEVMTLPLDRDALEASVDAALHKKRAVVIGPGLGTDAAALAVVRRVLAAPDIVKIVDADAITVLAAAGDAWSLAQGPLVLTPHSAELGRLLGKTAAEIEHDRFGSARAAAALTSATVVLKGARTLVASAAGISVNPTGTPALATAGSGDVLAGLLAALACGFDRGFSATAAAEAAVYLHGLAAEAWSSAHGGADRGLLASELIDYFPRLLASARI